ncbi:NAD(P)/FAD-dependent oxidoreductase [Nannocystis pusilla]|uniref:NAD(P)/FAD-dependent oxidoreductase n=1 Tax=Nannocystis pusilla TaxID=889268 RepID=UPI003BF18027
MSNHHKIVIVGGGTGGITVASRLARALAQPDIAIVEPSDRHYYQPLWTLVGGGAATKESTVRPESGLIPRGATWIRDAVVEFQPEQRRLVTRDGRRLGYDWLVVAPGIQLDWHKIDGLSAALGRDGVCSNYSFDFVDRTWEFIRGLRQGRAIFTMPNTPVKCGGAPQKIMWLAEHHFRRAGVRDAIEVVFASAGAKIFAVKKYADTLERLVRERDVVTRFHHNLIAVRPASREAVFTRAAPGQAAEEVVLKYDLLHVTPPMGPPDFVRTSPLADANGWIDVDKHSLQHRRFSDVFALGDASNLPTSKTGAAIRKQAPVLVANLLAAMAGRPGEAVYHGYTSCPLVTGYGRLVLAEFDYDGNPAETFPFDQAKERRSMYLLKKYALPQMYWHGMLRGRA